jgi:hypothetical protein
MAQPTSLLKGWLEIGMSNPNIFLNQSNSDIVFRTYDDNTSNKIIIGNTSSNNTPNCVGAIYIWGNNVGLKRIPRSNVTLDINGTLSVSSNVYIGTTSTLSTTTLTGDFIIANSNTSNMLITNTSNVFAMSYGNVERLRITNGAGLFLNDNIYVTNDIYASSFHMTSDKHLKDNISLSSPKGDLSMLCKLKVCDFTYKCATSQDSPKYHKGLIAQDVETVFPQAVQEYDGIIPHGQCFADITCIDNKVYIKFEQPHHASVFSTGDKIVLGTSKGTQNYIAVITSLDTVHGLQLDLPSSFETQQVFVHGVMGKIKTIDPNQLLALCISSIQEIMNII